MLPGERIFYKPAIFAKEALRLCRALREAKDLTLPCLRHEERGIRLERPLPTPIDTSDLFDYQIEGVRWIRGRERTGLLADEMGLGKSIQALRSLERGDRAILVCPASLRLNWLDEIRKFRPDLTARIARLPSELIPARGEVVIVSFDGLPAPVSRRMLIPANLGAVTVIVDEAHNVKNKQADRTKAVTALCRQVARTLFLTGTPLLGKPFDLMGVLVAGGMFREAYGSFKNFKKIFGAEAKYVGKKRKFAGYEFKNIDYAAANAGLLKVMLRRTRSVLPNLPPKVYENLPVEIEASQAVEHAEREWQLLGATELPPFELLSEARADMARAKIPAMLEAVDRFEAEELPLLVFSAHVEPIKALASRKGWKVITGELTHKERQAAVKAFQAGKLKGLGITIRAGGVGLTLTHAAHELFVDLEFTPALNQQAEDRAVRIGQEAASVYVARLVADHPLDRRLFEILTQKQELISGVVK